MTYCIQNLTVMEEEGREVSSPFARSLLESQLLSLDRGLREGGRGKQSFSLQVKTATSLVLAVLTPF